MSAVLIPFPVPLKGQLTEPHQRVDSSVVAQLPILDGETLIMRYQQFMYSAGRSTGTVNVYTNRILLLRQTHPDLFNVTPEHLRDFIGSRRTTHKAETRKSMRSAFKSFYGWAFDTGLTTTNVADRLPPIRIPNTLPHVAPDRTVQLGLITASTELTAMILLARYGCLRLTELTTLHMRQRECDLLRIIGKGEKERFVPLNDQLLEVLLTIERQHGEGYYFPGRFGGCYHPQSVNKMITRHLGVNPHSLRHAGATAAYVASGDLEALRIFLGHTSIATTQRYLHVGLDAVRRVAASTVFPDTVRSPHIPEFHQVHAA